MIPLPTDVSQSEAISGSSLGRGHQAVRYIYSVIPDKGSGFLQERERQIEAVLFRNGARTHTEKADMVMVSGALLRQYATIATRYVL
jgi:hypothetical protein